MSSKTVMVVDDSSTIRKIIQRELSRADYEVILAKSGMEALAMLEWAEPLPDLITLDIDMPGVNGFDICEKIRREAAGGNARKQQISDIPIIFVSANDTLENRERAYSLEVINFVGKPFSPGRILETVNNILNSQEQFEGMQALIVEDSPFVSRLVRNILARHGLNILQASDAGEALEHIKRLNFAVDIIITDYIMPGMSGEELCRTLRSLEAMEKVPIFFISTVDSKEAVLGFFKAGASDYLPKPFIEEEFRARIVTHLRNRKYVKELELLNNKLKFQADHDSLTGIFNRGCFSRKLSPAFSQAKHGGEQLCCILADLDYFKGVNDSYGHAFGDIVLVEFCEILRQNRRDSDIVARYGGEEFVLLLPDTPLADGCAIAEQLRKAAEGHIYSDGTTELQVTVSLGIVSLPEHKPANPDRMLMMADKALYAAKANGRNRMEVYSPSLLKPAAPAPARA